MRTIDRGLLRVERSVARAALGGLRLGLVALAIGSLVASALALGATWSSVGRFSGLVFDGVLGTFDRFGPLASAAWGIVSGLFQTVVTGGFAALVGQVALVDERLVLGGSTPSRVPIHEAWAEATELHGRPGLAVYVSVESDRIETGERLELTLRLRTRRGDYLGSLLAAFRGTRGEFLVRSLSPPWTGGRDPFQDCGLFVPVRAVDLPAGCNRLPITVEILVGSGGNFLSQYDLRATLVPDPGHPCRVQALPAASGVLPGSPMVPIEEGITDAGIMEVGAVRLQTTGESLCPVCGDGLDSELVHCSICETPHHVDCWAFAGRCSTFACEGGPTRALEADRLPPLAGAPDLVPGGSPPIPAAAAPHALVPTGGPAATLRRGTPFHPGASPGSGWSIRCRHCKAEGTTGDGGACAACGRTPESALPSVRVPPLPPGLWQSPAFALPAAGAVALAPVAALVGLLALAPIPTATLLAFGSLPFLADPQALLRLVRIPIRHASGLLERAFPTAGTRDRSPRLRLASVHCRRHFLLEGDGTEAVIRVLVRGLAGRRLDVAIRLRGPDGQYLAAAHPVARGVYGEFCIEYRTAPIEGSDPACREISAGVPATWIVAPPGAMATELTAEVLVGCEGHLLSEADVLFPWAPPSTAFAGNRRGADPDRDPEEATGFREGAVEPDPERLSEAGVAWCPLCTDGLGRGAWRCRVCARRSHSRCWEFLAACPACGADRGADE